MKILSSRTVLQLPYAVGEPGAGADPPYNIERVETKFTVLWYGYNTNWRYSKAADLWQHLSGEGKWVNTTTPLYERIYKRLIKNK